MSASAAASSSSSSAGAATASNLFRDGLHSVFNFLLLRELNAASQTSSHWRAACASLPPRPCQLRWTKQNAALTVLLLSHGPASTPASGLAVPSSLQMHCLTHHISTLDLAPLHDLSADALAVICRIFLRLTSIDLVLPPRLAEELDRLDTLVWPKTLRDVTLRYKFRSNDAEWDAAVIPRLLARLPAELRTLKVHTTCDFVTLTKFDVSQHLERFHQLEHLFLLLPKQCTAAGLFQALSPLEQLKTIDVHHMSQRVTLTTELLRSLRLPHLQSLPVGDIPQLGLAWEEPTLMDALAEAMPELEALTPSSRVHPLNYLALPRLQRLQRLELLRTSTACAEMTLDRIAGVIGQCRSLTFLSLNDWREGFSNEQWVRIFTGASSLTSLSLIRCEFAPFDFLLQATIQQQLRALRIYCCEFDFTLLLHLPHLTSLTTEDNDPAAAHRCLAVVGRPLALPALEMFELKAGFAPVEVLWTKQLGVRKWEDQTQRGYLQGFDSTQFRTDAWDPKPADPAGAAAPAASQRPKSFFDY
jgi:hypothetical protein